VSLTTIARTVLRRRGTGYLRSREDWRDELRGAPRGALPDMVMPESSRLIQRNQGATNSCTAHATDHAVQMLCAMRGGPKGRDYSLRSVAAPYWNARALAGLERHDGGAYLRDAFKAWNHLGAPPDAAAPLRASTINRQPGARCYQLGHPWRGLRYSRVAGSAGAAHALADGAFLVIGADVDADFGKDSGPHVIDRQGKSTGGHAMAVIGYAPRDGGGRLFRVVNSWGSGWRDHGRAWLTENFVDACEVWALEGWA